MTRAGLLCVFLLGACSPVEDDRQAWLIEQLELDNQRWLSRDPELLRAKYRRMAGDRYDFMRAMATVGVRDWTRPQSGRSSTRFGGTRDTESVLLAGDPHPENVGVYRPGGSVLLLEVNDLDGATWGPYLWDVRRGALGLGVLLTDGGCLGDCRERALEAYLAAYVDTLSSGSLGVHSGYGPNTEAPAILADLLAEVRQDGAQQTTFRQETEDDGSGRRLVRDATLDDDGRGDLELTLSERAQVARLSATFGVPVKDAVRRYGQGVASLPAVRYLVLTEDDRLLQWREVIDPLPLPGWRDALDGGFDNNADRIVEVSRVLWSRPDADPALDGAVDGPMAFKVTTQSGFLEGFEHRRIHERMEDGRFDTEALTEWSGWLGAQLASVHDRAPTRDGEDGGRAIREDLDGRGDVFVEEGLDDTLRSVESTVRDFSLFRGALERYGPDLGAR